VSLRVGGIADLRVCGRGAVNNIKMGLEERVR
jgi:hypothetical protein